MTYIWKIYIEYELLGEITYKKDPYIERKKKRFFGTLKFLRNVEINTALQLINYVSLKHN